MAIDKINPSFAANVYATMQKTAAAATGAGDDASGETGEAGGSGFGAMLQKAATSAMDTMHAGEKASASAVVGKADLADVVQAVNGAEFTLDTVIAVRDRMLAAYDKVMQMSV